MDCKRNGNGCLLALLWGKLSHRPCPWFINNEHGLDFSRIAFDEVMILDGAQCGASAKLAAFGCFGFF